jgi:hypothetical protein
MSRQQAKKRAVREEQSLFIGSTHAQAAKRDALQEGNERRMTW